MYNEVYDSLEEVIDFYNISGGTGLGLDLEYQTLTKDPYNLTMTNIKGIKYCMESLSDKKRERESG